MPYQLRIPARINILGNPSDANEGDFATISAAVNLYAYTAHDESDGIIIEQLEKTPAGVEILDHQEFTNSRIPFPYRRWLIVDSKTELAGQIIC